MIKWNSDQIALREGLARWHKALSDGHIEEDHEATFSWDKWRMIRESGILTLPFDEEWGGLGQDLITTMYVLEGLGYGCRNGGLSFSVTTHMASTGTPLQRFGSAELKQRYMPRVVEGELIGCHAISEPDTGSDALAMRTKAVRQGDEFVINGSKTFVSNGPVADLFVVYVRTNNEGGPLGITTFIIEKDTPGFSVGQPLSKMGLKTSPIGELFFDDCRVPASNVIGRVGGGFLVLDYVMKWEILCSFVVNVGEMQHRLERCLDYARTRTSFGKPIGKYQAIANKLVDSKIRLETARKWLYDTAIKMQDGENVTMDIAISKLLTSESNVATAMAAVQVFGGNGYMSEYGLEKDLRNAIAGTIYSGTTEIQYNRIASMLGL